MIKFLFGSSTQENPASIHREVMLNICSSLEPYLPEVVKPWRILLQDKGYDSRYLVGDIGRDLAEFVRTNQFRLLEMQNNLAMTQIQANLFIADNQRLLKEPLRQELKKVQNDAKHLSIELERTQTDLRTVQQALAAEQSARHDETDELRAYIAAQNRIIAQQQLRLNQILGETPGVETAGNT